VRPETRARRLEERAGAARYYTGKRDEEIVAWRAEGGTLRQIGAAAGLSQTQIANIVAKAAKATAIRSHG
jgi:hypothetical protein